MEKLAQMAQDKFTTVRADIRDIRENFATKVELHEEIALLQREMEAGFTGVNHVLKIVLERLDVMHRDIIEIHDLRARVERIEKKLDLRS